MKNTTTNESDTQNLLEVYSTTNPRRGNSLLKRVKAGRMSEHEAANEALRSMSRAILLASPLASS
jgi:hypothetical protein